MIDLNSTTYARMNPRHTIIIDLCTCIDLLPLVTSSILIQITGNQKGFN